MKRLLFVCHGNICRSPMAQSVMTYLVAQAGREKEWSIDSAAVSTEELGHPVHNGTRRTLAAHAIPCIPHMARQMVASDYADYDRIIGMDESNLRAMQRIHEDTQNKYCRLLDFIHVSRDVADPWYTGDFEATFADVWQGCVAILQGEEP